MIAFMEKVISVDLPIYMSTSGYYAYEGRILTDPIAVLAQLERRYANLGAGIDVVPNYRPRSNNNRVAATINEEKRILSLLAPTVEIVSEAVVKYADSDDRPEPVELILSESNTKLILRCIECNGGPLKTLRRILSNEAHPHHPIYHYALMALYLEHYGPPDECSGRTWPSDPERVIQNATGIASTMRGLRRVKSLTTDDVNLLSVYFERVVKATLAKYDRFSLRPHDMDTYNRMSPDELLRAHYEDHESIPYPCDPEIKFAVAVLLESSESIDTAVNSTVRGKIPSYAKDAVRYRLKVLLSDLYLDGVSTLGSNSRFADVFYEAAMTRARVMMDEFCRRQVERENEEHDERNRNRERERNYARRS